MTMPTLTLTVTPAQSPAQCQTLAHLLTQVSAHTLGKNAAVTAVMVHALPATAWAIGGVPPAGPAAMLEISITAGSNTAAQKAAFVQAAYAVLQQQLGAHQPLAAASYVVVRELPADNWGYAGVTQQARRHATAAP